MTEEEAKVERRCKTVALDALTMMEGPMANSVSQHTGWHGLEVQEYLDTCALMG